MKVSGLSLRYKIKHHVLHCGTGVDAWTVNVNFDHVLCSVCYKYDCTELKLALRLVSTYL